MNSWLCYVFLLDYLILNNSVRLGYSRRHRSVVYNQHPTVDLEGNEIEAEIGSSSDFIWYTQTVAAGDTAVLHCSFDAIFAQLRNGNINWARDISSRHPDEDSVLLAEGKKVLIDDRRYRVYRPHNSALSVLMIRRAKKRDAGIYRCHLAGSSTRHKYMALNVTKSKIDAKTSPPELTTQIGKDVTMWCNATGYPKPVVYWTREDHNRKLQDGSYQYWGTGLHIYTPTEDDTGTYACYLDNFVQPVVSYKFSVSVEDNPWVMSGYKMRFDSKEWYTADSPDPAPVRGMSYLLMCETAGNPKPVPQVTWLRNGRPVTNTKHFYIMEDRPNWQTGYTSSTLVIMRFVPRFQGNYTCVGKNVFRSKSETFFVNRYLNKAEDTPLPDPLSTEHPVKSLANILDINVGFNDVHNRGEAEGGAMGESSMNDVDETFEELLEDEEEEEEREEKGAERSDYVMTSIDASDDEDFTGDGPSGENPFAQ